MKTNYANFYFRSLCIKLVALRICTKNFEKQL